jgi:hypothetical protein
MTRYRTAVVSKAANVPPARMQKLLERGSIRLRENDRPPGGSGSQHEFSRNRVIQFALTQRMTELGISPSKAAWAALVYSDRRATDYEDLRIPSRVRTVLIGLPGGATTLVTLPPDGSVDDLLANEPAAFVIDCSRIARDVDALLSQTKK